MFTNEEAEKRFNWICFFYDRIQDEMGESLDPLLLEIYKDFRWEIGEKIPELEKRLRGGDGGQLVEPDPQPEEI